MRAKPAATTPTMAPALSLSAAPVKTASLEVVVAAPVPDLVATEPEADATVEPPLLMLTLGAAPPAPPWDPDPVWTRGVPTETEAVWMRGVPTEVMTDGVATAPPPLVAVRTG